MHGHAMKAGAATPSGLFLPQISQRAYVLLLGGIVPPSGLPGLPVRKDEGGCPSIIEVDPSSALGRCPCRRWRDVNPKASQGHQELLPRLAADDFDVELTGRDAATGAVDAGEALETERAGVVHVRLSFLPFKCKDR